MCRRSNIIQGNSEISECFKTEIYSQFNIQILDEGKSCRLLKIKCIYVRGLAIK